MNKKAFTLVELLAVIAILALLVIIALPNIMSLFSEAKKNSFENEVKNIYKTVEQQVMVDSFNSPNASETTYSSSESSSNHLSLKGRSDLKYCVVVNGANKITKLYVSDGQYLYISEDIDELSNIENIHVDEVLEVDLSDIENCVSPPADPSLLLYTISNNEVTITGIDNFEIEDSQKCIDYFTENNPFSYCDWNQTNYCSVSDYYYSYCGTNSKNVILSKIPESDYKKAGLKVKAIRRIEIPEEIEGKPVTSIASHAFYFNGLTSITLPSTLTSIGSRAFSNNKLASINLPNNITSIGEFAFAENKLNSVTVSNGLTTITRGAFQNNELTSVSIPNVVTSIGSDSFKDNKLTSLTIPNNVTTIGSGAFSNNKITSLTIPSSGTSIEQAAFNNNSLPDGDAFIYKRTTSGIDTSTVVSYGGVNKNVVVPNNVTELGDASFSYCKISSIVLPNGLITIGGSAFSGNELETVTIPNSVTTIKSWAFAYNKLNTVTIPNSVTKLNNYAFYSNQLTSVKIKGKTSASGFTTYGSYLWGWAEDVTCVKDNRNNVTNGCITWNAS